MLAGASIVLFIYVLALKKHLTLPSTLVTAHEKCNIKRLWYQHLYAYAGVYWRYILSML